MKRSEWIEATTLADLLMRSAELRPMADAIIFPDERATYQELVENSQKIARNLTALGIAKGDHIGILMPNCMDFLYAFFGCAVIGAVIVPINARLKSTDLPYVIKDSNVKLLITTDKFADYVDFKAILQKCFPEILTSNAQVPLDLKQAPDLRKIVVIKGITNQGFTGESDFEAMGAMDKKADERTLNACRERIKIRDLAVIMYTSGTTSNPKGARLTHEALVRTSMAMNRERFLLSPDDSVWTPAPLFHLASILPLLASIDGGAKCSLMSYFDAQTAIEMMENEKATVIYPAFPPITQAIIDHPKFGAADLSKIRLMINVGPPETLLKFQRAMSQAIQISAYGCTEISGVICQGKITDDEKQRSESSGEPYKGTEVKIIDDFQNELGPGEIGEILVRGYQLFEGYYNDASKTKAAIDQDGWFHTGDLGHLDKDGRVTFIGRKKDMLKVGGENVSPVEVEVFLSEHPAILMAAVIGVPDERLIEVPAAFVEVLPGASLTEKEVIDYCSGKIAKYKVPRYIEFISEWPTTPTDKIQKFKLKEFFFERQQKRETQQC